MSMTRRDPFLLFQPREDEAHLRVRRALGQGVHAAGKGLARRSQQLHIAHGWLLHRQAATQCPADLGVEAPHGASHAQAVRCEGLAETPGARAAHGSASHAAEAARKLALMLQAKSHLPLQRRVLFSLLSRQLYSLLLSLLRRQLHSLRLLLRLQHCLFRRSLLLRLRLLLLSVCRAAADGPVQRLEKFADLAGCLCEVLLTEVEPVHPIVRGKFGPLRWQRHCIERSSSAVATCTAL